MTDTTCIRCKFFRMKSSSKGICRLLSKQQATCGDDQKHQVKTDFSCEQWQDCGQQYYIRLGWMKGQAEKKGKE